MLRDAREIGTLMPIRVRITYDKADSALAKRVEELIQSTLTKHAGELKEAAAESKGSSSKVELFINESASSQLGMVESDTTPFPAYELDYDQIIPIWLDDE